MPDDFDTGITREERLDKLLREEERGMTGINRTAPERQRRREGLYLELGRERQRRQQVRR